MTGATSRGNAAVLAVVTFAAGVCGLAYEQLYSRLLTTYLGDLFYVDAAILAAFLGGMGAGALWARRLRSLWWCELGAGAYAALVALLLAAAPVLETVAPLGAHGPFAVIAVVGAFAAPPALLLGVAIPWLADADRGRFARVYALYNVGAAACVLAVEGALLPHLGLRLTLVVVGGVNVLDAALLFRFARARRAPATPLRRADRQLATLALMSVLSGLSQLFVLKIAEVLVGPYHESFAMLLCGNLVGISVAAAVFTRLRAPLAHVCLAAGVLTAGAFCLVSPLAHACARLFESSADTPSTWMRFVVALPLAVVPAAAFGATVPALERRGYPGAQLLFVSCAGNVVGYAAGVLVVWEHVPDGVLATLIPGAAAATALLLASVRLRPAVVAALALALAPSLLWPKGVMAAGDAALASTTTLAWVEQGAVTTRGVRKLGTEASLVRDATGDDTLVLDGYVSMRVSRLGRTNPAELIVGAVPPTLAARRERALVLGLGTGISAGATASLMQHTRVVEVSPAVLALAPELAPRSLGLFDNDNVEIVQGDGLSTLAADTARYDVILNTVNIPRFYASSKLYSADFLALARAHLAPGGVYAAWVDASAGPEGIDILSRTLLDAFPACVMVALKAEYAELVCGDAPSLHPARWGDGLIAALEAPLSPDALLKAIVFPRLHRPPGDRVHTLDLPWLELVDGPTRGALRGPWEALTPDLGVGGDGAPLDDAEVAVRCEALARLSRPPPPPCR